MATETPKRERQAFDFERAYYENLATKADVEAIVNGAKSELIEKIAQQDAEWAKMGTERAKMEARLTWRVIISSVIIVAAQTLALIAMALITRLLG